MDTKFPSLIDFEDCLVFNGWSHIANYDFTVEGKFAGTNFILEEYTLGGWSTVPFKELIQEMKKLFKGYEDCVQHKAALYKYAPEISHNILTILQPWYAKKLKNNDNSETRNSNPD